MNNDPRFNLHFGPYYPPSVHRGDRLFDEILGTVVVGRYSDGEIPWPTKGRRTSLVLCGDLMKAVRQESVWAVCLWWGVSTNMVRVWRRALGVDPTRDTPGTQKLRSAQSRTPAHLEAFAKHRKLIDDPVYRTGLARLRRKRGESWGRRWTEEDIALMGVLTDRALAVKLGCSEALVSQQRRLRGIASLHKQQSPNTERISKKKLVTRRLALRLSQKEVKRRSQYAGYGQLEQGSMLHVSPAVLHRLAGALECRPEDILLRHAARVPTIKDESLLGKVSDRELARRWSVPCHKIRSRRIELGVPPMSTSSPTATASMHKPVIDSFAT